LGGGRHKEKKKKKKTRRSRGGTRQEIDRSGVETSQREKIDL